MTDPISFKFPDWEDPNNDPAKLILLEMKLFMVYDESSTSLVMKDLSDKEIGNYKIGVYL